MAHDQLPRDAQAEHEGYHQQADKQEGFKLNSPPQLAPQA